MLLLSRVLILFILADSHVATTSQAPPSSAGDSADADEGDVGFEETEEDGEAGEEGDKKQAKKKGE